MERYLRMELPPTAIGDWAKPPVHRGIGVGVDAHRTVLEGEALRSAQAGYFGLINHIDDQLYWLLREFATKSRQAARPWIVVFTTDHGEMMGDHYFFRKCEPYEGSSRIPFLIQGSNDLELKAGLQYEGPVCLEDVMPTLLDCAGIPVPEGVDGESLLPVLRGEAGIKRSWLHGEHSPCYDEEQAYHFLTDGKLKYIWRPTSGTEQLFDLENDSRELHDLFGSGSHESEVLEWRRRLIERLKDRPEGFTDGDKLISGRPYDAVLPHAKAARDR